MNIKNITAIILSILLSLIFANATFAHGYVTGPASRAYLCHTANEQGIKNEHCGPIQWEPQSVEQVTHTFINNKMNNHIPSANNERFSTPENEKGIDEQSENRWHKNTIEAGKYNFVWHHTANHATTGYRFYMTKPGWDANKPLTRAEFDDKPFCALTYGGVRPPMDLTIPCDIPQRQGYQVILAVWDVNDTVNSFYQVIDVKFSDGSDPTPTFDWNVINDTAKNWLENSNLGELTIGDEIILNVVNNNNAKHVYSIHINSSNRTTWQDELAEKINQANSNKHGFIRVGLFDNASKQIYYQPNSDNKLYINSGKEDVAKNYRYSWVKKPAADEPADTWVQVSKALVEHQAKVIVGQGVKFRLFNSEGREVNEGKEPILSITAANKDTWQKALATLVDNSHYPILVKLGVLGENHQRVETPDHSYEKYNVYIAHSPLAKEYRYELDTVKQDDDMACTYRFKMINNWGGGYQAELTVDNLAESPITDWKITFPSNSAITVASGWNGKFALNNGQLSITNEAWNGAISANGGQLSGLGFTAKLSKPQPDAALEPASLWLNGKLCQKK